MATKKELNKALADALQQLQDARAMLAAAQAEEARAAEAVHLAKLAINQAKPLGKHASELVLAAAKGPFQFRYIRDTYGARTPLGLAARRLVDLGFALVFAPEGCGRWHAEITLTDLGRAKAEEIKTRTSQKKEA